MTTTTTIATTTTTNNNDDDSNSSSYYFRCGLSLANLPSITVDPLFPSFLVHRQLMKMQFFARSFSIFILISPIIRVKHHTAVRHDCLHEMFRFHITFAKMAISWLRPIGRLPQSGAFSYCRSADWPRRDHRIHIGFSSVLTASHCRLSFRCN